MTTPPKSNVDNQPNFVYRTDNEGRFQSDGLAPGSYLVTVGGIYRTEDGKSQFPIRRPARS